MIPLHKKLTMTLQSKNPYWVVEDTFVLIHAVKFVNKKLIQTLTGKTWL